MTTEPIRFIHTKTKRMTHGLLRKIIQVKLPFAVQVQVFIHTHTPVVFIVFNKYSTPKRLICSCMSLSLYSFCSSAPRQTPCMLTPCVLTDEQAVVLRRHSVPMCAMGLRPWDDRPCVTCLQAMTLLCSRRS